MEPPSVYCCSMKQPLKKRLLKLDVICFVGDLLARAFKHDGTDTKYDNVGNTGRNEDHPKHKYYLVFVVRMLSLHPFLIGSTY